MEVEVKQLEGVRFSVQARTHSVVSDQPHDNGGKDAGMTPPELLLASLGTCSAFYAAEYLRTRDLSTSGLEISVAAEKLHVPNRLGNFRISVKCPVCLTPEQREGLMRSIDHCMVKNTLLNPPQISVELSVPDPGPDGI